MEPNVNPSAPAPAQAAAPTPQQPAHKAPPIGAPKAVAPPPPPIGQPSNAPRRIGDAPAGGTAAFTVTRGRTGGAQRVLIYGAAGIGKSSLAALAPDPIVLDTQDETRQLDVARVPTERLATWDDLRAAVRSHELWRPFKTVVIDNLTRAQQMAAQWCVRNIPDEKGRPVDTLEGYGYGKGSVIHADTFRLLLQDLDVVMRAGKHVVLVAHETTESVPNPRGEDYLRYEPDLYKSASGKTTSNIRNAVIQWADHVVAIYYDVAVDRGDNKAKGGGTRTIYTVELPTHVAKTRPPEGVEPRPIEYVKNDPTIWRLLGCN